MEWEIVQSGINIVSQLVTIIPDLAQRIARWRNGLQQNPKTLHNLRQEILGVESELSSLISAVGKQTTASSSEKPQFAFLRHRLSSTYEQLCSLREMCDDLSAQNECTTFCPSIVAAQAQQLDSKLQQIRDHLLLLLPHIESMNPDNASLHDELREEVFCKSHIVERNQPDILHNFDGTDSNGNPLTCEARLKHAILKPRSRMTDGGINVRVVTVVGMSGSGKTIALRSIAGLQETKQRFPDAVLLASVGIEANEGRLITLVADMVKRTGGIVTSRKIRCEKLLRDAIDLAREWFFEHVCLFVIDDISLVRGKTSNCIMHLTQLAGHPDSCVTFSTQDHDILCGERVKFRDVSPNAAEILLHSAQMSEKPTSEPFQSAFHAVLSKCYGLPCLLNVVGRGVRAIKERHEKNPEHVWIDVDERMNKTSTMNWSNDGTTDIMNQIIRNIRLNLTFIQEEYEIHDIHEKFQSLSILRKQQSLSLKLFSTLWGLDDVRIQLVLAAFERFSLLKVNLNSHQEMGTVEVTVHDIVLDVARRLGSFQTRRYCWGERLIKSYIDKSSNFLGRGKGNVTHIVCLPLLKELEEKAAFHSDILPIVDDTYIMANTFWLLQSSQLYEDIVWLSFQPAWIVRQISYNGITQVIEDIETAIQCMQSPSLHISDDHRSNGRIFLNYLRQAVLLCHHDHKIKEDEDDGGERGGKKWDGMIFFQLYGRLVSLSHQNALVHHFLICLEKLAPRPWMRPTVGCLPAAGGSLERLFSVSGKPLCMMEKNGDILVCCYAMGGILLMTYGLSRGVGKVVATLWGMLKEDEYASCGSFSNNGEAVILGLDTGGIIVLYRNLNGDPQQERNDSCRVSAEMSKAPVKKGRCLCRCFERETSKSKDERGEYKSTQVDCTVEEGRNAFGYWEKLYGHADKVTCVASTANTECVVSSSNDRTVHVWHKENGIWTVRKLCEPTSAVLCADVSNDGNRVACGCKDGSVHVWNRNRSKVWIQDACLQGHKQRVRCIALSSDDRRIVSGSDDWSVRLWEEERNDDRTWTFSEMKGHMACLTSVSFSKDERSVISGSYDRSVRIWDLDVERKEDVMYGHEECISDVVLISNGRNILSATEKGTMAVWNVSEGIVENRCVKHLSSWAFSVAVSRDGTKVAAVSENLQLVVWERQNNSWRYDVVCARLKTFPTGMAFSDDGRLLYLKCYSDSFCLTRTRGGSWVKDEKHMYGHEIPDIDKKQYEECEVERNVREAAERVSCFFSTSRFYQTCSGFVFHASSHPFIAHVDLVK